ncbi:MAG: hypothetical protein GY851_16220 [bacterium]|nr:hypothetical protein [bacterium]
MVVTTDTARAPRTIPRWEIALVVCAAALALLLGSLNLSGPSLWHDELVHVYTAKSILEKGVAALPSGRPQPNGAVYNYMLAAVMALLGPSESAMRMPAVLAHMANVLLTYAIARRLLGRGPALVAAFALASSPWSVAWARQARFYTLHQTVYLVFILSAWGAFSAPHWRRAAAWTVAGVTGYAVGLSTSLHSLLFLGAPGAYAGCLALRDMAQNRTWRTRWIAIALVLGAVAAGTLGAYYMTLPQADRDAIFKEGGLDGSRSDPSRDRDRSDPFFYPRFLCNNLSTGYFVLAMAGFALMIRKEGWRGLFMSLAFLIPMLALSYIGYRRFRFMYFAFPFYVAGFSYGLFTLVAFFNRARRDWRRHWLRTAVAVVLLLFTARIAMSTVRLMSETAKVSAGAHITLARRHPQWREPCRYVRDRLTDDDAVLTTTYLPAHYYVGHVDEWYPSRIMVWEMDPPTRGIPGVPELRAFIDEHPRGWFLAERRRFKMQAKVYADDIAWVNATMVVVEEASNEDVTVYRWGD